MNNTNLDKILNLEKGIETLLDDKTAKGESELEKKIARLKKLLDKASNQDLLYLLSSNSPLQTVVNILTYFKPYDLDKEKIKMENSYQEAFEQLSAFVEKIRYVAINDTEYLYICYKCDIDKTAEYLLSNMSNEDIMELSNKSNDWDYKLFLFGNLKA